MKTNPMDIQVYITLIIVGLAAGILSGMVGVGGGIILVPAMVFFFQYTQHQAQGTSLGVLTFPVTILAFLSYYNDCRSSGTPIEFKVIGLIAGGFLVGSFLGSKIAVRLDQETMKKIFAVILFYTAFKMLNWDQTLLRWVKNIFS